MTFKKILLSFVFLLLSLVLPACQNRQDDLNFNKKTQKEPQDDLNYSKNKDINISDWETLNSSMGLTMKYPPFLDVDVNNDENIGFFSNSNTYGDWNILCLRPEKTYIYEKKYKERVEIEKETGKNDLKFHLHKQKNGIVFYKETDRRGAEFLRPMYVLRATILGKNDMVVYCVINLSDKEEMEKQVKFNKYGKFFEKMMETVVIG